MDGFVFQKLLEEKKRKGGWLVEVVVVVLEVVVLEVVVLEDVALAEVVVVVEEEVAVDVELVLVVVDFDSVVVVDACKVVTSSPDPVWLPPWFEELPLPLPLVGIRSSADAICAWPNIPVKAPPRVRLCLGTAQCLPLWCFPALVRHSWRLDERGDPCAL